MTLINIRHLLSIIISKGEVICSFIWLRLRVVPLIIFCAGLLLTVKVNKIWNGIFEITEAEASSNESTLSSPKPRTSPSDRSQPSKDTPLQTLSSSILENKESPLADKGSIDVLSMTPEEFSVLTALAKRHDKLGDTATRMQKEEKALAIKNALFERTLEEIKKANNQLEKITAQTKTENESDLNELAKSYEKMKPSDAAEIFDKLDPALTVELLRRIKPDKKAPIIAKMKRETAVDSTQDYVHFKKRHPLPISSPSSPISAVSQENPLPTSPIKAESPRKSKDPIPKEPLLPPQNSNVSAQGA